MHPYNYVPPPAPKKNRNALLIVLLSCAGLLALSCAIGVIASALMADEPQSQGIVTPVRSPDPDPSPGGVVGSAGASTAKKVAPKAKVSIGEGMWLVGTDVPAGTYKTAGATEGVFQFCSWSIRAGEGSDADLIDFGTANKANEPKRATIKNGQVFETSGCKAWTKQ